MAGSMKRQITMTKNPVADEEDAAYSAEVIGAARITDTGQACHRMPSATCLAMSGATCQLKQREFSYDGAALQTFVPPDTAGLVIRVGRMPGSTSNAEAHKRSSDTWRRLDHTSARESFIARHCSSNTVTSNSVHTGDATPRTTWGEPVGPKPVPHKAEP